MLVGTSGWQYADWRGVLYPPGLAQKRWLERYGDCFQTVENNGTFYRLPARETFEDWRARTPDDFVMTIKASRYLTHVRRLADPKDPVHRLLDAASGLGDKLGPVLLQLPPTLEARPDALAACLSCFPSGVRVAVEPRHASWWTPEIKDILRSHAAALCWSDRFGRPQTPLWRTTEWAYLRFHQGASARPPSYGDAAFRSWLRRLDHLDDAYVYFNNDATGAAVRDATRFARLATRAGHTVSRATGGC
ncbi:histidine kinase [Acrocarpospora phusangensis]|uniref:Histidine kinase n=1 Tax=Acrocarpospora phusangensis TaxID=1070424 RepID=A0A919QC31_9ACTN|nr:DUF72 domain-containing protein [Acrocarpospora phusangensis]GIH24673.1 histidine kinase [Acrocarpospora phusangensis]